MLSFFNMTGAAFTAMFRDRVIHALVGAALLLSVIVPVCSIFSMRQVQELTISLSLSAISLILLLLTVILAGFAIWRDVERRYTASVLGLPISRHGYVLGKFTATGLFLLLCAAILTLAAMAGIAFSAGFYPSEAPVKWMNIFVAIGMDVLKYILLAAFALFFSSLSTSFFLPVFGTIAIYFAGSASQEVVEYIGSEYGQKLSLPIRAIAEALYYLLPNFSAFNLKVEAVYGLPLSPAGLALSFCYFVIYTGILLLLSVRVFSRRELP